MNSKKNDKEPGERAMGGSTLEEGKQGPAGGPHDVSPGGQEESMLNKQEPKPGARSGQ